MFFIRGLSGRRALTCFLIIAVLLAAALSSCSREGGGTGSSGTGAQSAAAGDNTEQPGYGAELYQVGLGTGGDYSENINVPIVDRGGNYIMDGRIIYNLDGSAAVAIQRQRYEADGKPLAALYDVKGKLLRDFGMCGYGGDAGNAVRVYEVSAREDDPEEEWFGKYYLSGNYRLYDMATGELGAETISEDDVYEEDKYGENPNWEYLDEDVGIKYREEDDDYDDDTYEYWYDLIASDGKVLFGDADELEVLDREQDGKAKSFFAQKDGKAYVLDRDGSVLSERENGEEYVVLGDGYLYYEGEYAAYALTHGAVLDSGFKTIVDGCDYAYIVKGGGLNSEAHYTGTQPLYIVRDAYDSHGYDIFDLEGNPILEGVYGVDGYSSFGFGPDRLVARRGFFRGLMDMSGNWLWKESIFNADEPGIDVNGDALASNAALAAESAEGVTKGITQDNFPRVDGSTANLPLLVALYSGITGVSMEEAGQAVTVSKTDNAWRGITGTGDEAETNLIVAYEPIASVMREARDVGVIYDALGRDGLVFLTGKDNPVDSLTQEQLKDIYSGKITNWKEVGGDDEPIAAFQRNEGSGSQTMFEKLVMKGEEPMKAPSEYVPGDMGGLIERLAGFSGEGNAIGYSVYYYADAMKNAPELKMIKVDGVAPETKAIAGKSYPLTNDFYVAMPPGTTEGSPARQIRDFLLSDAGAEFLESAGYVPAR